MYRNPSMLLATLLAFAGGTVAAPVTQFAPDSVSRAIDTVKQADETEVILVQNRGRGGGGGGGQRAVEAVASAPAGGSRSGSFNSNNFHQDVSNSYKRQRECQPQCERQPKCERKR